MSTELTIKFTGLCLLVPHPNEHVVSVFLPGAKYGWRALDGHWIEPHLLRIVHRPKGGGIRRYKIATPDRVLKLPGIETPEADKESVRDENKPLVRLGDIVPSHPMRWPGGGDRPHPLRRRIELRKGGLVGYDAAESWKWEIDPWIAQGSSNPPDEQSYAWMVTWKMEIAKPENLPDLDLQPDDHSSGQCQPIKLKDLDPLVIEVWHVPEHHLPGSKKEHHLGGDHDHFRWFYEFLQDTDRLQQRARAAGGLPIPWTTKAPNEEEAKEIREVSPNTHDCLPGTCD